MCIRDRQKHKRCEGGSLRLPNVSAPIILRCSGKSGRDCKRRPPHDAGTADQDILRGHLSNRFWCLSMHFANKNHKNYFTSWSNPRNSSELKKSPIEIPRPSHIFFIVVTVVLWLRLLTILFTVDCVTPLKRHNLLIDKLRSRHNSKILALTASPISTGITSPIFKIADWTWNDYLFWVKITQKRYIAYCGTVLQPQPRPNITGFLLWPPIAYLKFLL